MWESVLQTCIHTSYEPFLWTLRYINLVTERNYFLTSETLGIVELILADTVHKNKSLICVFVIPDNQAIFGDNSMAVGVMFLSELVKCKYIIISRYNKKHITNLYRGIHRSEGPQVLELGAVSSVGNPFPVGRAMCQLDGVWFLAHPTAFLK